MDIYNKIYPSMSRGNKDEKIQVLLSSEDHHKLKNIILNYSMLNGKLMTSSAYVRELILNHVREYEGEQTSFVNEKIKEIIQKTKFEKNITHE
jgi:hypothetical protein